MSVFDKIFNVDKNILLDNIFFNIKTIAEFKNLEEFSEKKPKEYDLWINMVKKNKLTENIDDDFYHEYASYNPEFGKVAAISYGEIYNIDNQYKRLIKHVEGDTETEILENFFTYLNTKFIDGQNSSPKFLHNLTGHGISNFDIPFLIKRYLISLVREPNVKHNGIPFLFKIAISAKPWESIIIDTLEVNKFGGNKYTSLNLISELYDLKKTIPTITDNHILSIEYWNSDNKTEVLDKIINESKICTNLTILFLNKIKGV